MKEVEFDVDINRHIYLVFIAGNILNALQKKLNQKVYPLKHSSIYYFKSIYIYAMLVTCNLADVLLLVKTYGTPYNYQ